MCAHAQAQTHTLLITIALISFNRLNICESIETHEIDYYHVHQEKKLPQLCYYA